MILKAIVILAQVRKLEGNQAAGVFGRVEVPFTAWVLESAIRLFVLTELRGCRASV